jgi:uncharacterized protein (DUF433 family)
MFDMVEIVSTSDTLGGKPRIEGTRVSAEQVYEMYSIRELDAEEIADELPSITSEQVEAAIEFMEDRKDSGQSLKA